MSEMALTEEKTHRDGGWEEFMLLQCSGYPGQPAVSVPFMSKYH